MPGAQDSSVSLTSAISDGEWHGLLRCLFDALKCRAEVSGLSSILEEESAQYTSDVKELTALILTAQRLKALQTTCSGANEQQEEQGSVDTEKLRMELHRRFNRIREQERRKQISDKP